MCIIFVRVLHLCHFNFSFIFFVFLFFWGGGDRFVTPLSLVLAVILTIWINHSATLPGSHSLPLS